jgi:hypothetical protein
MTTLKTLLVAAALAVTIMPAAAQIPLGYTIFNDQGKPAAVGMPQPQYGSTTIYWPDGRRGSTMTSALTAGNVLSLLRQHIGCTDKANAQIAWTPRLANPAACALLLPNVPYDVVGQEPRGNDTSLVHIKQGGPDGLWILLSTQGIN